MKIFYLTARCPYPLDKGDKLRAYYQLKYLSRDHEIYLFCIDDKKNDLAIQKLKEIVSKIKVIQISKLKIILNLIKNIFTNRPFQVSYYFYPSIKKTVIAEIEKFKPDLIFCQLIRTSQYIKDLNGYTKVLDYVDALSKGLERRMQRSKFLEKFIYKIEWLRVLKYEKEVYQFFDGHLIISETDKKYLPVNENNMIKVLPNGIDLEFYKYDNYYKEYDLLFSGNLNYPPNVDASVFIAKEILPELVNIKPDIKILIAGSSPNWKVRSLKSRNVTVRGWIDDIREYYRKSKIFVAPMRLGSGLQNKILQAMAMGLPCVVSEIAAMGLGNDAHNYVLVARDKFEFAEKIKLLLENEKLMKEYSEKGFNFVRNKFDWQIIADELNNYLINISQKTQMK
jgi:sugar transferase (PEP-CTERM/EpsH1 system associated)